MPFVSVKCPSCGGDIQLDDSREFGFCIYCGAKVMYKEAVQKMELSGEVSVKGIADLDKLLQNAETFQKIGDYDKAKEILAQITQTYPEDWRGWWRFFLLVSDNKNIDIVKARYNRHCDYKYMQSNEEVQKALNEVDDDIRGIIDYFQNGCVHAALSVAPEGKKCELQSQFTDYVKQLQTEEMRVRGFYKDQMDKQLALNLREKAEKESVAVSFRIESKKQK